MNAFIELSDAEQFVELVKYTAKLLEGEDGFAERLSEKIRGQQYAEVLSELIRVSPVYFKKDTEAVFNNVSRLLRVLKSNDVPRLAKALASTVASDSIKGSEQLRLRILCNLFNNLERESLSRYHTYLELLTFAGKIDAIDALSSQFGQLSAWLQDWKCDKAQVRDCYRTLASVLLAHKKIKLFVEYQSKYLATFNGESTDALKAVVPDVTLLINTVIADPDTFEASAVLQLAAVKQLAGTPVFELLRVVCGGDVAALGAWLDANKGQIQTLGFSEAAVRRKVRLLTLAALCARAPVIEFAAIAASLQVPIEEIESWVIDVIRAGLVEAKLDELNEKLLVSRSTHTEFGLAQWAELQKKLQAWSHNLAEVQQVLDDVRSQIKPRSS